MEVIVSARHFTLGEALGKAAEQAVTAALDGVTVKISTVRVTLDCQKSDFSCDIVAMGKDVSISAQATAVNDMSKAIAEAADRLNVQARRYLDKKQDHRDRETLNDIQPKENP